MSETEAAQNIRRLIEEIDAKIAALRVDVDEHLRRSDQILRKDNVHR